MKKAEITEIDQFVIDKVREMRKERRISQRNLADLLDMSYGFIGDVESPKEPAKYNLSHLNQIAKIFKCSIKDFLPDKPL